MANTVRQLNWNISAGRREAADSCTAIAEFDARARGCVCFVYPSCVCVCFFRIFELLYISRNAVGLCWSIRNILHHTLTPYMYFEVQMFPLIMQDTTKVEQK